MEHTGIEAILNADDPTEKRLALRSHAIEPYHLRLALQDEDPEVRGFAAHHPKLTPELIQEVINGDDRWLASHVLNRPDIRHHEIEQALKHDDLRLQASRHVACTPELKERLLQVDDLPEGLRRELETEKLGKNIGYLLYPKFGVSTPRNRGGFYTGRFSQYPANKDTGPEVKGVTVYNALSSGPISPERARFAIQVKPPKPVEAPTIENLMYLTDPKADMKEKIDSMAANLPRTKQIATDKKGFANESHETQHGIYAEIAQKHGIKTRDKVIAATVSKIPTEHQQHIDGLFRAYVGGGLRHNYKAKDFAEEKIAFLHNYLMDPEHRHQVHVQLGVHRNTALKRQYMETAKKAWKSLQQAAQSLSPDEIQILGKKKVGTLKKEDWVNNLAKNQGDYKQSLHDFLGFEAEQEKLLEIARLLTGREIPMEILRARLIETDDEIQALMEAAGLPAGSEGAIKALLQVQGMQKSQIELKVKPLAHNAVEVAEQVQKAANNGNVESVKLSGKHSKGTMLARGENDEVWLLKPGSGKQSPAAGAQDDLASQSRRECAFFEVSRIFGILDVPEAYLLSINGKETACIRMLGATYFGMHRLREKDAGIPRRVLKEALDIGLIFQWSVMDYVLGNTDRHGNNLIVGPQQEVALIDHGAAFAGVHFSPGTDSKSFVPYYLRIWGPDKGWSRMGPKERLKIMPTLSEGLDQDFAEWVENLDEERIAATIRRFGIHPEPSIARLQKVKLAIANARENGQKATEAMNSIWVW
jgi:hypothetical protein